MSDVNGFVVRDEEGNCFDMLSRKEFLASVRRVGSVSAFAIPGCAAMTLLLYFLPAAVCIGGLCGGLIAFIVGSDAVIQSKTLCLIGGTTMFGSLLAAALRGLLG